MRPETLNYSFVLVDSTYYGELVKNNKPNGRGIRIYNDGAIRIGYFENEGYTTGNYIWIFSDGGFIVGELLDGGRSDRGTTYWTDGTVEEYDY
jgi:hypothetical protein